MQLGQGDSSGNNETQENSESIQKAEPRGFPMGKGEGKDFGSSKLQRMLKLLRQRRLHIEQMGEADKEFTFKHAKFKMFLRTLVLLYQLGEPG